MEAVGQGSPTQQRRLDGHIGLRCLLNRLNEEQVTEVGHLTRAGSTPRQISSSLCFQISITRGLSHDL
jgi:hypothetical protein